MKAISALVSSPFVRLGFVGWVFFVLVSGAVPAGAESVPIVFAVDTSRSLSAAELRTTTDAVLEIVRSLGEGIPLGILAFDDAPRWVVEPPGDGVDVAEALESLSPNGNFTVLNDALFTAARRLPDGGVILLLTDGRDENSATTVEDVANLCVANKVRVLSLSTGRWVDEKALRRYSLLSEGDYLGRFAEAATGTVGSQLEGLRRTVEAENEAAVAAAVVPESPTTSAVEQASAAKVVEPIAAVPWWLLPGLVVLILAVLVVLFLLWRLRRQSAAVSSGADEEWETDPAMALGDIADQGPNFLAGLDHVPPNAQQADELKLDPSAFERLPFDGELDKTSVLDEHPVLTVMEPGKPLRTFRLSRDRAFAVGRAPKVNTLTLGDRALSGQHFKIVPHDGAFVVVDLEATNGTLVNGRRIRAQRLESGDSIRAGEIEFEFKTILKPLG